LGRLPFPRAMLPVDPPLLVGLEVEGFENDRNPSFEVPLLPGVDATRASLGDIAGARYSPPVLRAETAERLLKSPALAVAATAGRP